MEPISPKYITAIAAIIGALVPITATINGCYSVQLERQKHQNTLQLNYLDRAIDPDQEPQYRESVLKFLEHILSENDAMKSWATKELDNIREVLRLRTELAKTRDELTALRQEATEETQSRIEELEAQLAAKESELSAAASRASVQERFYRPSDRVTNSVNVRAEPFSEAPIVGRVTPGTPLKFIDEVPRWVKVESPSGLVGWVGKAWVIEAIE